MASEWSTWTVEELISQGVLAVPLDGNHGAIHPKSSDFVAAGVPFIMASDLIGGRVDLNGCAHITSEQAGRLRKGFAKAGDVLLSHKATIGRTAILQASENDFVVLTPQVTYYRVQDPDRLNNRFLKYYFDASDFQQVLSTWAGAGSTRAYLGITAQRKLPILLPPIEDQETIASVLGALDDKIAILRETNATLEAIAQALFKSWFVDFDPVRAKAEGRDPEGMPPEVADLFPSEFEDSELGAIPKGWESTRLSSIAELKGGKQLDRSEFHEDGPFPIFGGAGIMGRASTSNADGFVIVVGRVGAYCGQFFWHQGRAWVNNNASQVLPLDPSDAIWTYSWLDSVDMEPIKKGAAQPFVSNGDIANLKMVKPTKELRNAYRELVVSQFEKRASNDSLVSGLSSLRDTLLPRLMSGKLRISSVNEAPV